MTTDDHFSSDHQQVEELAAAVAQRFAEGRTPAEVIEELHEAGWPADSARDFVEDVHAMWKEHIDSPEGQAESEATKTIDLSERFPELTPMNGSPSLFTLNGFGFGIYGARDHDPETNTYVKTYCVSALFLPVFALKAYRVFKAPEGDGWYFIGKSPLSRFAVAWNFLVFAGIAGFVGLGMLIAHLNSPEYLAGEKLDRGIEAEQAGEIVKAARLYSDVGSGRTSHAKTAADRLAALSGTPALSQAPAGQAAEVLQLAARLHATGPHRHRVFTAGSGLVRQHAGEVPHSVDMYEVIAPLEPDPALDLAHELLQNHWAGLPPADAARLFAVIGEVNASADRQQAVFRDGLHRVGQLAEADLAGSVTLLKTVAPLGDSDQTAAQLDLLIGEQLDKQTCSTVCNVLEIARSIPTTDDHQDRLARRAIAWVPAHDDVAATDLLTLLDLFSETDELSDTVSAELLAQRQSVLERLVREAPDNLERATQLAAIHEQQGDSERIRELLTPHRAKLNHQEAARILGQALVELGEFDEAHALLNAYLEHRLPEFHAASEALEQASQNAQEQLLKRMNMGIAPGFSFEEYSEADEARQNAMVVDYVSAQISQDPGIAAAQDNLAQHAAVVPVALDLGIVSLRQAQRMSDPEQRRKELEKAERTFLAIRGAAGDSDEYRLYTGQIYYWLGRHEEGRAAFDELLENHNRSYQILMGVADILYDVGATGEVRRLTEEAWNKSRDDAEKHAAANRRALVATETDERITWLKRSDQSDLNILAELANSQGQRAFERGDREAAARHLREAVEIYGRIPETAASLNNSALTYQSLYVVTGERAALENSNRRLKKSVALAPGGGISLTNLASNILTLTLLDLVGPEVPLHRLGLSADMGGLKALANDRARLDALRDEVGRHEQVREMLDHVNQAIVVSPKRTSPYTLAIAIHSFMRNPDELETLSDRIDQADLDVSTVQNRILEGYREGQDQDVIARWQNNVDEMHDLLTSFRKAGNNVAFALAVSRLSDLLSFPQSDEATIDADELVALAEEAHANAPSLLSRSVLIDSLLLRAGRQLAAVDPEYGALVKHSGRALDAHNLIPFAAAWQNGTGEIVRGHDDVKRAVVLIIEKGRLFPDSQAWKEWALLNSVQPEAAEAVAEHLADDRVSGLMIRISGQLAPGSASTACAEYWQLLAGGEKAAAEQILRDTADMGVPLPVP